jgi:23S rRNA (pseudouridine1915-N3)-methyltransferase
VKLTVLCVGKPKGSLKDVVEEYEERARRYWRLRAVEVEGGLGKGRKADPEAVLAAEEERLLARCPQRGEVIALSREGKPMASRELARYLEDQRVHSTPEVTFLIGGAFGLGQGVLERATRRMSLSRMTFPHEMARLVLVEQLYRAGTILRNEPYHKGG